MIGSGSPLTLREAAKIAALLLLLPPPPLPPPPFPPFSKQRRWNNKGSRTPDIHAFSSEENLLSAFLQLAAPSGLVRSYPGQLAGAFCKAVAFITGENSLPLHKALLDPGPRNQPCT